MTAGPQQPGWWLESDGQWYPPESGWDPPESGTAPAPVPELFGAAPSVPGDPPSDRSSDQWSVLWSPPEPAPFAAGAPKLEGDTLFAVSRSGRTSRPKRRNRLVGAGVSLAAVIALVVGLVGAAGTPGTSGTSANSATASSDNMVLTSARSTLAAKTADLHLSMVIQAPGVGQVTGHG